MAANITAASNHDNDNHNHRHRYNTKKQTKKKKHLAPCYVCNRCWSQDLECGRRSAFCVRADVLAASEKQTILSWLSPRHQHMRGHAPAVESCISPVSLSYFFRAFESVLVPGLHSCGRLWCKTRPAQLISSAFCSSCPAEHSTLRFQSYRRWWHWPSSCPSFSSCPSCPSCPDEKT